MAEFVSISGLDGVLDMLQKLPAEVVGKRGGPVLKVLKKAARVIQKQEKANLAATLQDPNDETTGLLMKAIIVSRGKPPADGNGERVLVRIKRLAYTRSGKVVTTLKTAQIKEYGSEKQPAESFIRPAFNAKAEEAIRVVETDLPKEVVRIAERLGKR